jgi:hypothetical protein
LYPCDESQLIMVISFFHAYIHIYTYICVFICMYVYILTKYKRIYSLSPSRRATKLSLNVQRHGHSLKLCILLRLSTQKASSIETADFFQESLYSSYTAEKHLTILSQLLKSSWSIQSLISTSNKLEWNHKKTSSHQPDGQQRGHSFCSSQFS